MAEDASPHGLETVLQYHDYLALTAGLDAEWTRKHHTPEEPVKAEVFADRFDRVFKEIQHIADGQRAKLTATTEDQQQALKHLYRPVHSLPIGHADALTLMLLDDFDLLPASLIENWLDQTEKRTWFLFEAARDGSNDGH